MLPAALPVPPRTCHHRPRCLMALLLAVALLQAGCMSSQRLSSSQRQSLQQLVLVPVELPVVLTPALQRAFEPEHRRQPATGLPAGPGAGVIASAALLQVLLVEWPQQQVAREQAMQQLADWQQHEPQWSPQRLLIEAAASRLRQYGYPATIAGAQSLPGVGTPAWSWHGEAWMQPRRDWYRRGQPLDLSASVAGTSQVEITVGPLEVSRSYLALHLALKVFGPSGTLLGRSNCADIHELVSDEQLFPHDGRRFKVIYHNLMQQTLTHCLQDSGLLAP